MPFGLPPDALGERAPFAAGAIWGAAVAGLYMVATRLLAGERLALADFFRLAVNILAAAILGVVVAVFAGPPLMEVIPFVALKDAYFVGFVLGAVGWELWPVVTGAAKRRADRIVGGPSNEERA